MNWDNDRLPARALTFWLAVTAGTTPPFLAFRAAGPGGLYALVIGLLLPFVPALALAWLAARHPGVRFGDLLPRLLGPVAGRLVAAAYLTLWGGSAALFLRQLGEEVRFFLLPATPLWIILLLATVAAAYAAAHGVEPLGRTLFILVPLGYGLALLFVLTAIKRGEIGLALAFPEEGAGAVAGHALRVAGSVGGFTSLLVLGGYLGNPAATPAATAIGLGLAFTFVTAAFLAAASVLSLPGLALYHWPLVAAMQTAVLPGFLVEKLDLFFLSGLLLLAWARLAVYLWLVATGIRELLSLRHGAPPALAVSLAVLALALVPGSLEETVRLFTDRIVLASLVLCDALAPVLTALAWWRHRPGRTRS